MKFISFTSIGSLFRSHLSAVYSVHIYRQFISFTSISSLFRSHLSAVYSVHFYRQFISFTSIGSLFRSRLSAVYFVHIYRQFISFTSISSLFRSHLSAVYFIHIYQQFHSTLYGYNKFTFIQISDCVNFFVLPSATLCFGPVFLNRRAAARYRALASIIPGRERFSWNW